MMKNIRLLLVLLFTLPIGQLSAQIKSPSADSIITVSDIHFDPFYDPSLVKQLIASDYRQWLGIFNSSSIQKPNGIYKDSNFPLFKAALAGMKSRYPKPRYIIATGDFLEHSFQNNYRLVAPNQPDSLTSFTTKTVRFIALMFNMYFPDAKVLPVLGNNDSYCGDYMIGPDSRFLKMFAKAWVSLQRNHNTAADSAFVRIFSKGGYYTYALNNVTGAKLVMLNTVFFSNNYADACDSVSSHPAAGELTWLADVLKRNAATNSKLWLVCHIPPGMDTYATLSGQLPTCAQNIKAMWRDSCSAIFLNLWAKNSSIIQAGFAGHTHMDDFRLMYQNGVALAFMHINPAVSPKFGNNPAFQVVHFNKNTFCINDISTYILNLNPTANTDQSQQFTGTAFNFEYGFCQAYHIKSINPLTLNQVRNKIAAGKTYRDYYIKYFDAGNAVGNGINQNNWRAYWCGTGNMSGAEYVNCYCIPANQ